MSGEQTTAVALTQESKDVLDGLMVVREVLAPDLTVAELQLFALVATRSGLDPFARQIYAVKRRSGGSSRMTIQTGIDGYRSIAARTGEYDGQDEPIYGPDCECTRLPKPHPVSSTVRVYRKGMGRPVGATAFWHEYVPDAGPSGAGDVMWRKMPHVMIAKVAEALALRKAFPWDPSSRTGIGSDIYTSEEMAQADAPIVSVSDRVAERAAAGQAGIAGVTVRYFADAVRDMDPDEIRRVRAEMYPEASGVSGLDDEQRARLLDRLIVLRAGASPEEVIGEIHGEEAEAMVDASIISGDPPADPEEYIACGDALPPPLGQGETCVLEQGHGGAHQDDAGSRWPNRKGSHR